MIIEQAGVSDAEEILSLQKIAYKSEAEIYKDFNIAPLIQTLEEIKRDFRNQVFLKAVIQGKIIGSVRAFAKEDSCWAVKSWVGIECALKSRVFQNMIKRMNIHVWLIGRR
jgi:hypothetical protein